MNRCSCADLECCVCLLLIKASAGSRVTYHLFQRGSLEIDDGIDLHGQFRVIIIYKLISCKLTML